MLSGARLEMQAIERLANWSRLLPEHRTPANVSPMTLDVSRASNEVEAKAFPTAAGVPVMDEGRGDTPAKVVAAAGSAGYPVVVKRRLGSLG